MYPAWLNIYVYIMHISYSMRSEELYIFSFFKAKYVELRGF